MTGEQEKAVKNFALQCAMKGIDVEDTLIPFMDSMDTIWEAVKSLADKNERALLEYLNKR